MTDPSAAVARPLADLQRLDGRVAVVTGAARGIGLAVSTRLAEAGAHVVLADVDGDAVRAAGAQVHPDPTRATCVTVDVTRPDDVEALASRAVADHGRLDVWVNNAGIFPRLDAVDVDVPEFERVMRLNVLGVQLGLSAAVRAMRAAGRGGVVVNVASTAAYRGSGGYSASKWAVRGLTEGAAPELGRDGIRVVAVAPTVTMTPGMRTWLSASDDGEDVARRTSAKVPLGRACEPDDVARAIAWLASDAASFITGVTLPVDGGSLRVIP